MQHDPRPSDPNPVAATPQVTSVRSRDPAAIHTPTASDPHSNRPPSLAHLIVCASISASLSGLIVPLDTPLRRCVSTVMKSDAEMTPTTLLRTPSHSAVDAMPCAGCGEVWRGVGRCGEVWSVSTRCRKVWIGVDVWSLGLPQKDGPKL